MRLLYIAAKQNIARHKQCGIVLQLTTALEGMKADSITVHPHQLLIDKIFRYFAELWAGW